MGKASHRTFRRAFIHDKTLRPRPTFPPGAARVCPSCVRGARRCVKLRPGESVARFGSDPRRQPAGSAEQHISPPLAERASVLHFFFRLLLLFSPRFFSSFFFLSSFFLCFCRPPEKTPSTHFSRVRSETEDAEPTSPLPHCVRTLRTHSPDPPRAMTAMQPCPSRCLLSGARCGGRGRTQPELGSLFFGLSAAPLAPAALRVVFLNGFS